MDGRAQRARQQVIHMGTVCIYLNLIVSRHPDNTSNFLPFYRSVHNSRIERLWYDVTVGFGRKWKEMFQHLEAQEGLNTACRPHKWLLCHLFLSSLNDEAKRWQGYWNNHMMSIRGKY